MAEEPPDRRTLTQLHTFLAGDEAARQTLRYYLKGQGPYGELFDGVVASYGEAAVVGVETQDIVQLEEAAPLAIAAVFRALRRDRLVGDAPKLVIVDEAWSLLQQRAVRARDRELGARDAQAQGRPGAGHAEPRRPRLRPGRR